jgi:hypothetical protein
MRKRERVQGRLNPPEKIDVCFREHPFSVFMRWEQGASKAERCLYVAGQNQGKMLCRPAGVIARALVGDVVQRDLDAPDVKDSGRFPITDFGLKRGMENTLFDWKAARRRGALHVEYLGIHEVQEIGDRPCYKLRRTRYERPEYDGITGLILYIDRETWLQVGSVLTNKDGALIGEYFFSDVRLNPPLPANQFERAALLSP